MTKRARWADIAKGLGILMVVFGHWGLPKFLHRAVYSFHMPLFFALSGVFLGGFLKQSAAEVRRIVFVRFVVPFVFFWCAGAATYVVTRGGAVLKGLAVGYPEVNKPLWFLIALMFAELLAYVLARCGLSASGMLSVTALVCMVVEFVPGEVLRRLPLMMGSWAHAAFFLCAGYCCRKFAKRQIGAKAELVVMVMSGTFVLASALVLRSPFYMAICEYPMHMAFLATGLCGIVGVVAASRFLERNDCQLVRCLCWLGANSLCLFAMDRVVNHVWRSVGLTRYHAGVFFHLAVLAILVVPVRECLRRFQSAVRISEG